MYFFFTKHIDVPSENCHGLCLCFIFMASGVKDGDGVRVEGTGSYGGLVGKEVMGEWRRMEGGRSDGGGVRGGVGGGGGGRLGGGGGGRGEGGGGGEWEGWGGGGGGGRGGSGGGVGGGGGEVAGGREGGGWGGLGWRRGG